MDEMPILMNFERTVIVDRAIKFLVLLCVFLFPFNGMFAMPRMIGEFSYDLYAYPLIIANLLFCIVRWKYCLAKVFSKDVVVVTFAIFLLYCIGNLFINYPGITSHYFQGRTGLEKFVLQFAVLAFAFVTFLLFLCLFEQGGDGLLRSVSNFTVASILLIIVWGVIEVFDIQGSQVANKCIYGLNQIIRPDVSVNFPTRVRCMSGEPSWLGGYVSFAFPFLLVRQLNSAKFNAYLWFIIHTAFFVVIYFTFSRITYAIVIAECLIAMGLSIVLKKKIFNVTALVLSLVLSVFACVALNGFGGGTLKSMDDIKQQFLTEDKGADSDVKGLYTEEDTVVKETTETRSDAGYYKWSNVGRIASWRAALNMGKDRLLCGQGLGQYGFLMGEFVPEWGWTSPEIKRWADNDSGVWPPALNLHFRIFGELGIIGFLIWIAMWGVAFFRSLLVLWRDRVNETAFMCVLLIPGIMLAGFSADSFKYAYYWLTLALSCYVYAKNIKASKQDCDKNECCNTE